VTDFKATDGESHIHNLTSIIDTAPIQDLIQFHSIHDDSPIFRDNLCGAYDLPVMHQRYRRFSISVEWYERRPSGLCTSFGY
jgi:hypothetical protein